MTVDWGRSAALFSLLGVSITEEGMAERRALCEKYQLIDPLYSWGFPWETTHAPETYDPMADYVASLRKAKTSHED